MKFIKTFAATLLLSAGLMSAQAMAAGYYGGASLGQSKFNSDGCNAVAGTGISCDDKDTSFKIFGGYNFAPNLSGEIGYLDLGKIKLSNGFSSAEISGNAVYIDAVGNYPLANNFSLLGRIGFANATIKTTGLSDSKTKLHFGFGGSYDISPTLSLRGEWEQVQDLGDSISVGLAVKF
jgi:OmpA-OmpF porin, OOP family